MDYFVKPRIVLHLIGLVLLAIAGPAPADPSTQFPHRGAFPNVVTISAERLAASLDDHLIVDVRSEFEFDIVHIQGAHNAPMATMIFANTVERLRERFGAELPIVVYCNGMSCRKSYEAADILQKENIKNVVVYDEGIDAWLHKYPALTVLVGKPATHERIIRDDQLDEHVLDVAAFTQRLSTDPTALTVDIRDPIQRTIALPVKAESFQLDKFSRFIYQNRFKDRPLFIIDAVGKQVRWLQYLLIEKGYQNYYFLQGGAESFKK